MNPGLSYHEDLLSRIVLDPEAWSGGADYSLFRHSDSLHTFTQAYGRPQARHVCWCVGPVHSHFHLDAFRLAPDRQPRFLLKLVAAWKDWKKHAHPVTITVNGRAVVDGPLFLENVLTGWPAQYFELSPNLLCAGRNKIVIRSGSGEENVLLLSRVEILRRPDRVHFTVHRSPEVVATGESFWIALHLLRDTPSIRVETPVGQIEFLERSGEHFVFRALGVGQNASISFHSDGQRCDAVVDRIVPRRHPGRVPIWVGLDGDDVRHDTTGEMDRVLEHVIYSDVGNYVGFRASPGRNFCASLRPGRTEWKRWIRQCRDHGVHLHYSGAKEYLDQVDPAAEAGAFFSGQQFHEPYLVFQPFRAEFMTEALRNATDLLQKKEAYVAHLRDRARKERTGTADVFSGEPSLTCLYSAEAGVDGLLCEPVSNVSLLYGAARGSGLKFGAHIPADWYFGYPHDASTLRRLELAVWLAYAYGGQILYVESSVFKTNAHDRKDWEDDYCRGVRRILRDFYRFAQTDERLGRPCVALAFLYGNLESMFWMEDDRIAETVDMGHWDRLHWGLPGATSHRRCWNASEAWLPRVPLDDARNESLTRMFTGTPYGPVDIVLPTADLSRYQAVAFLGWNTMTEEIYARLLAFVEGGGTLFLCGCHLDSRVALSAPPRMIFGGKVASLIGANLLGPGREVRPGIRSCDLESVIAKPVDENFFRFDKGGGRVFFGNFFDYPADSELIAQITGLLRTLGETVRDASPFRIETQSPYLHYSVWEHQKKKKLYAVDADWRPSQSASRLMVRDEGRVRVVPVPAGTLTVFDL